MAQEQTQTTQTTEGNGTQARGLTAVEAIKKITKVLDQLTPSDRKRVLAFVSESGSEA